MSSKSFLIYSAADVLYEHYVAPYIYFALVSNKDAFVEILVSDGYIKRNEIIYNSLRIIFGSRFLIVENEFKYRPDISRFVMSPKTVASYVYIGDIDIMIVESILDRHLHAISDAGMPYSNIVREDFIDKGIFKLTGLHFTDYKFHFPVDLSVLDRFDLTQYGSDETVLYAIVKSKGFIPSLDYKYRPLHGLHLSPHGFPISKSMGWGIAVKSYFDSYIFISSCNDFLDIYDCFSEKYKIFHDLVLLTRRAINEYKDMAVKLYPFGGGR